MLLYQHNSQWQKYLWHGESSEGEGARTEEMWKSQEKGKIADQKALETANAGSEPKTYFIKTQTVFPDS